jgi:hypothetical protein
MSTNHEYDELKPIDIHDQREPVPIEIDTSEGYEKSDVGIPGILVFIVALTVMVGATGALVYGVGKILNARMENKYVEDYGKVNRWTKQVNVRDLGNLANSPELQQKTNDLMQKYPTPRLQNDQFDGAEDIFSLHQREDLLLEHYSWVDQSKGKVRIPIDRAMDLIVAKGLPVAPETTKSPLLAGDEKPAVTKPLTNGFARTGYELAVAQQEAIEQRKLSTAKGK